VRHVLVPLGEPIGLGLDSALRVEADRALTKQPLNECCDANTNESNYGSDHEERAGVGAPT
jgi:hypothetical protein